MADNQDVNSTQHGFETTMDDKARNPLRPRLGEYSNNPADLDKESAAARQQVTREVGDYTLRLDPLYPLWCVERTDGKPVPKMAHSRLVPP